MTGTTSRGSKVSVVIVVLVALQLVLVGARAAITIRAQGAIPSAPSLNAIAFPTPDMALTIQSGAERGDLVAAAWSSDAVLAFASMQVDWPTETPPSTVTNVSPFGWIRLMYVAPVSDGPSDYAALSLMFERVSGKLADARVSRWDVAPDPGALLDGISVSDQTAILAAEIDRGTAYRTECPAKRNGSMVSITRDPVSNEPIWSISYDENGRDSGGSMLIAVNASTGAVTDIRSGPTTCAENG